MTSVVGICIAVLLKFVVLPAESREGVHCVCTDAMGYGPLTVAT
mgnify:FL=1|jgi:hypothetical protein